MLSSIVLSGQAERAFIASQTERRSHSEKLLKLQSELVRIRTEMEKLSRSDDAYFESFKTEHDLVKKEKLAQLEIEKQDNLERQLFSSLQLALRESQEKEKLRIERTKYWSIIGSVLGALAGMIGKYSYSSLLDDLPSLYSRSDIDESVSHAGIPSDQRTIPATLRRSHCSARNIDQWTANTADGHIVGGFVRADPVGR